MPNNAQFEIVPDPNLVDIGQQLTILANNMARLENLVAEYKRQAAFAKTKAARIEAAAYIRYRDEKNAALIKAHVVIDDDVIVANNELDAAEAKLTLAQGELAGYDAQFVAVRKQAELKKMEMQALGADE